MRYLSLYRPAAGEEGSMPSPEHMAAMGELIEKWTKAGKLISTEPTLPREAGCVVTRSGGRFTVSDLQNRMGGFAFLQADSKEELIALTKEFLDVPATAAARSARSWSSSRPARDKPRRAQNRRALPRRVGPAQPRLRPAALAAVARRPGRSPSASAHRPPGSRLSGSRPGPGRRNRRARRHAGDGVLDVSERLSSMCPVRTGKRAGDGGIDAVLAG